MVVPLEVFTPGSHVPHLPFRFNQRALFPRKEGRETSRRVFFSDSHDGHKGRSRRSKLPCNRTGIKSEPIRLIVFIEPDFQLHQVAIYIHSYSSVSAVSHGTVRTIANKLRLVWVAYGVCCIALLLLGLLQLYICVIRLSAKCRTITSQRPVLSARDLDRNVTSRFVKLIHVNPYLKMTIGAGNPQISLKKDLDDRGRGGSRPYSKILASEPHLLMNDIDKAIKTSILVLRSCSQVSAFLYNF